MHTGLFSTILTFAFLTFGKLSAQSTPELVLMSYNIRFDNPGDGENRWALRKAHVAETLRFYDVHLCGMQEALKSQINDLLGMLPGYAYVGVGRDDGKEGGEFSPILYDTRRLQLLENQTFWLSPTPERPSKGWDAALPRVATWAKFRDLKTKKVLYAFNTHFDHIGVEARRESAALLIRKVQEIAGTQTAFVMGDFNAKPEDAPIQLLMQAFSDCKALSRTPHFGPESTFNGFGHREEEGMRIDYIFSNTPAMQVRKHATLSQTWAGKFASDHHAVVVVVRLR